MSQPLVSIVTPMYNGAEFLEECIESILSQTYQNWDYTIVDNCSKDASLEIARRYAARDSRIRIHENTLFLPAIANHNAALRQASPAAKYCKVVFSDDWIYPECLEKMVEIAERHPSAGIVGAYCLEGSAVICTGLPYQSRLVGGREIGRRHLLENLHLFGSANSLLYRADLVRGNDPFFNEENVHADNEVCFKLLQDCDFGFVPQVLTFTRLRPGSLNTVSNDIYSYYSSTLGILQKYGASFLTEDQLRRCLDREVAAYYRCLGRSVLAGRDKKFWEFHKKKLLDLGLPLSRQRLALSVLANVASVALHPRKLFGRLGLKTQLSPQ